MPGEAPLQLRPIRSYVRREGRMTEAQHKAFERLWHRYGIEHEPGELLQPDRIFANTRPLYLEIGFGNGAALLSMATQHPEYNYLGIEVHRPGVGHLLQGLEAAQLGNVRVLCTDAADILRHALPEGMLDGIFLFFPDPWPKKKHHKRRFVQPELVRCFARALRPGARMHMATDWADYARHMLACMEAEPAFSNNAPQGGYVPRPDERPVTRFEQRGLRLGHQVRDLVFTRNPEPS